MPLVLTQPAGYTLETRIKVRPSAPESLRRNLEFLGPAEPDGSRLFNLSGTI